ncbi:hypothetical protein [Marinobacter xestospongiae]|uniref:Uncharacterized protein n=1 Tax=Marinobacter xestospongiae TaxID=994319 RepID=A0ABU3VXH3_9GAMM|nr:hypothetical protein [Marinobacter xestospongiae]MDV2078973.1 hypothetical protein [Marinobacter xestospongiae]
MNGRRDVNLSIFHWLMFSLVVYGFIVFGIVLLFSGKVPHSASEVMSGLSEHFGVFVFISNNSPFSDIAQVMFVFNLFLAVPALYVMHCSGAANVHVVERGVWKHLFASLSLLILQFSTVYFDMSSSSPCATNGCRAYDKFFEVEILFLVYLSTFLLMFSVLGSQVVFCISQIVFKKNDRKGV